ncbi:MAG TPA: hypothetical protein VG406_04950 [Isosphaeraceae bacterium]|jgi:hypothetical protein|nr:hypothetical protein [Isosphaeraceae bacterium]
MLVLKRNEGQWVDVIHKSGDVLRVRVYDIGLDNRGRVNLAFDDSARNFEIQRPERLAPRVPSRRRAPSREEVTIVP